MDAEILYRMYVLFCERSGHTGKLATNKFGQQVKTYRPKWMKHRPRSGDDGERRQAYKNVPKQGRDE